MVSGIKKIGTLSGKNEKYWESESCFPQNKDEWNSKSTQILIFKICFLLLWL